VKGKDDVDDELDDSSESEDDLVQDAHSMADKFCDNGVTRSNAAVVSEIPEESSTATTSTNKGNRADVCANDPDDNLTLHQLESGDEDDGGIVDNSDDDSTDA